MPFASSCWSDWWTKFTKFDTNVLILMWEFVFRFLLITSEIRRAGQSWTTGSLKSPRIHAQLCVQQKYLCCNTLIPLPVSSLCSSSVCVFLLFFVFPPLSADHVSMLHRSGELGQREDLNVLPCGTRTGMWGKPVYLVVFHKAVELTELSLPRSSACTTCRPFTEYRCCWRVRVWWATWAGGWTCL